MTASSVVGWLLAVLRSNVRLCRDPLLGAQFCGRARHKGPEEQGACVRVTWLEVTPADADQGIDAFRTTLPTIEGLDGFCSASLMVDRSSGRPVLSVTFHIRDAVEGTRDQASGIRSEVAQDARGRVLEVAEFELAVAHLRVPEMA